MKNLDLFNVCKKRKEINFLYKIASEICSQDSIGDMWSHGGEYTRSRFEEEIKRMEKCDGSIYTSYLEEGALPIYELYLIQIKFLNKELRNG